VVGGKRVEEELRHLPGGDLSKKGTGKVQERGGGFLVIVTSKRRGGLIQKEKKKKNLERFENTHVGTKRVGREGSFPG